MSAAETPPQSIEILYSEHHNWLKSWLSRRLGDCFTASDLAHDTFMRVLTKDVPPVIREPRALLTTIAQGLVLNLRRRQRMERAYLDALALMPEPLTPSLETQALRIHGPALSRVFLWCSLRSKEL